MTQHDDFGGVYERPTITVAGTVEQLTQSINILGGGDNLFSLLLSSTQV